MIVSAHNRLHGRVRDQTDDQANDQANDQARDRSDRPYSQGSDRANTQARDQPDRQRRTRVTGRTNDGVGHPGGVREGGRADRQVNGRLVDHHGVAGLQVDHHQVGGRHRAGGKGGYGPTIKRRNLVGRRTLADARINDGAEHQGGGREPGLVIEMWEGREQRVDLNEEEAGGGRGNRQGESGLGKKSRIRD